MMICRII